MRIGILGGGQLARMLALAGAPLGLECVFLDPAPDVCAGSLGEHLCGDYRDPRLLGLLAERCEVVTFEFENVPASTAAELAARGRVFPPPRALEIAQDRWLEKRLFGELGIPTPSCRPVSDQRSLGEAVAEIGLPALLKTRTQGYDGKGQWTLRRPEDADGAWEQAAGAPCLLEPLVPFGREVSVIAVRGRNGQTRFYPLCENTHGQGILRLTLSRPNDPLQGLVEDYAGRLVAALDYVGVLALELFHVGDRLLANEFAPRVHNSGHWTIEGATTSQFENHWRAILGLPLGDTAAVGHAAMANIIGALPDPAKILAIPGAHLHLYGKQPKPARKLGHVTVRAESHEELISALLRIRGGGISDLTAWIH